MFNIFKRDKKKQSEELYFGLILKENEGESMVLRTNSLNKTTEIIDSKTFTFTNSWEHLVEDTDAVLFELEQKNNIHVEKVIFFLYSHLVDQDTQQVKKPYLQKIKNIVSELELKTVGYIEHHESIALYLNQEEESPLTAVIAEIDKPAISIFVYKSGKMTSSATTAKTEDLLSDLTGLFTQMKGNYLPTRIIMYDSGSLEDESTKIMTHQWDESLFIQIPRVEVFSREKLTAALLFSFSKQLFGESVRKDFEMLQEPETIQDPKKNPDEIVGTAPGFIVGEDIADAVSSPVVFETAEETEIDEAHSEDEPIASVPQLNIVQRALLYFRKFNIPKLTLPQFTVNTTGPNALILIVLGLIISAASLFALVYFFHTASVTLFFQLPKVEKEITIDAAVATSSSEASLRVDQVEQTIEESDSTKTTGKKTIGNKAKGEVTILNLETHEKTFKKGTVLQTDGGIKFELDNEIKVSSASSTITAEGDVKITTGKQKASVTAVAIGPEGNIKKDTRLTIENMSADIVKATANTDFSGGTRQDVTTVSKDDLQKLLSAVEAKIKIQGNEIVKQKSAGTNVIDSLTKVTITKKTYSKEVSEEAPDVSLKASASVVFYVFDDVKLKNILAEKLAGEMPSGSELTSTNISYTFLSATDKDGVLSLTVKTEAKPAPKIDKTTIAASIKGKTTSQVGEIVKNTYKAAGYSAHINTTMPFLANRFPFFSKNIIVHIDSL